MAVELEELLVQDAAEWRSWLEATPRGQPRGVARAAQEGRLGHRTGLRGRAEEALCFGWIDGQVRRRDEESYVQRMTRRGPKSVWSARNVGHIARLEAAGRMTAAGGPPSNAAKADGRWEAAYAGPAAAEVPADLAAAIAADPRAQAMFEVLTSVNRYALIYRTNSVKQASTRERKIAGFVEMLAR